MNLYYRLLICRWFSLLQAIDLQMVLLIMGYGLFLFFFHVTSHILFLFLIHNNSLCFFIYFCSANLEKVKVHPNLYVLLIQLLARGERYAELSLFVVNKVLKYLSLVLYACIVLRVPYMLLMLI